MRQNFACYKLIKVDGYGRSGLGFIKALRRAGHNVYPFTLDELDNDAWYQQARGLNFGCVTTQFCPPHMMRHVPGRSVAFSMHESMNLPEGWANHVNTKSQFLIVPSPWLIEVFKEGGVKVPIEVVPLGISPEECPILDKCESDPYTFLCLADRGNRKGWQLVLSAFYRAFPHDQRDVRLIIKCRPDSLPKLDFSYSADPRLTVWKADVDDIADVFAQAHVCVNPNHCEGYGLFPREAAACGLPTIVTRWSGTADDADEWAIPLNKFTMVESGMEGCGGLWAQPDLDELVETMRYVYQHQDDARAIGLRSAQWLRQNQTYKHAADKLVNVLNKYLGAPPPKPQPEPTNAEVMIVNRVTLAKLHPNGHRIAEPT